MKITAIIFLRKMLNLYQYNVREYYICDNITSTCYINERVL